MNSAYCVHLTVQLLTVWFASATASSTRFSYCSKMFSARMSFMSLRHSLTDFSRLSSSFWSLSFKNLVSAASWASVKLSPVPSFDAHNPREFNSWERLVRKLRQASQRRKHWKNVMRLSSDSLLTVSWEPNLVPLRLVLDQRCTRAWRVFCFHIHGKWKLWDVLGYLKGRQISIICLECHVRIEFERIRIGRELGIGRWKRSSCWSRGSRIKGILNHLFFVCSKDNDVIVHDIQLPYLLRVQHRLVVQLESGENF